MSNQTPLLFGAQYYLDNWRRRITMELGTGYREAARAVLSGEVTDVPFPRKNRKYDPRIDVAGLSDLNARPVPVPVQVARTPDQKLKLVGLTSASTDDLRRHLSGVAIDYSRRRLFSTDGRRLFILEDAPVEELPQAPESALHGYVAIYNHRRWPADHPSLEWIDGIVAPVDKVMPQDFSLAVSVNLADLAGKVAGVARGWKYTGRGFAPLRIIVGGTQVCVAVNYLADAFKQFRNLGYRTAEIVLAMRDPDSNPVGLRSQDHKAKAAIMPMVVSDEYSSVFLPVDLADYAPANERARLAA